MNRFEVTVDGESVVGVHHPAGGEQWLVCCHGFRSDKEGSYESRCRRAVAEGYDAVRFDCRGCGESDGEFAAATLSARLAELRAVLDHVDPAECVLFGSSFGGKVALHHAVDDDRVGAVAARAPVTYNRAFEAYRETVEAEGQVVFEDGREIDQRFFEDFATYDFSSLAAELDIPVALFHGRDDESVPVEDSFDAAATLSGDVLLEAFAGEGHRFSRGAERRLRERLFAWLASV